MTNQELINYYANLLILQYLGKTNAYATIQALVTPVIMGQLPIAVQNAFNMDGSAQGVQLDVLGKYVGVSRNGVGFQGQNISLNDADFLILIRMATIKNSAQSDLSTIQDFLFMYFPNEIFLFDYQNMQISYLIKSSLGSVNLIQLFIKEGLLPKPMAVSIASVIYLPEIDNLFGFRTYAAVGWNVSPFNDYASYQLTYPWLTYGDAI